MLRAGLQQLLYGKCSYFTRALNFVQNARPIGNQLSLKRMSCHVSTNVKGAGHTLTYLSSAQNLVLGPP